MTATVWHRRFVILALVALAALTLLAQAQAPGSSVDITADAANPAVLYVSLTDNSFAPASFTVRVGQTVRFELTTVGRAHHHDFLIFAPGTDEIIGGHPGVIPLGETASVDWTPTAPGVYRIGCAVCPWMTGTIRVVT